MDDGPPRVLCEAPSLRDREPGSRKDVCCDCSVAVSSVCAAGCVTVTCRVPVEVSWVAGGAHERLGGDVKLRGLAPTVLLALAERRD